MRVAWSVVALALAFARVATAEPTADSEFKRGRELLKAGKFAEACDAFTDSDKLDPQLGTEFNIAQCDEKIGKLVAALRIYRDLAARDTNADRRKASADDAAALAAHTAKLHIQLQVAGAPPPDLAIQLDGSDVTTAAANEIEVDPGMRTITTAASGFTPTRVEVEVPAEGVVVPVVIVIQRLNTVEAPAPPPVAPPAVAETRTSPHRRLYPAPWVISNARRTYTIAAVAGGAALVGIGLVAGAEASSKFGDAQQQCPSPCSAAQAATANATVDDARKYGFASTVLVSAGGAALAIGAALWLTRPHEAAHVAVSVDAHQAGFAIAGRF